MADVARLAQVSVPTVSRVINEHPAITEETCKRVKTAIAALGYRPNSRLRQFFRSVHKGNRMIALLADPLIF
ncbi:MAG: LacI family DNA-binding transcriptional regulator, partial [Kiritimatiellae bacterium]|nr:LacI family DNA-binding transcriptional regulator [Kiritimatiellia bacterium]